MPRRKIDCFRIPLLVSPTFHRKPQAANGRTASRGAAVAAFDFDASATAATPDEVRSSSRLGRRD